MWYPKYFRDAQNFCHTLYPPPALSNMYNMLFLTTCNTVSFKCKTRRFLTSGGICPLCIWPIVTCCWGEGMMPMLKVSGPLDPERITAGSATEPCSTFPVRLNCCCKMVDLKNKTKQTKTQKRKKKNSTQRELVSKSSPASCFSFRILNCISQRLEKLENSTVFFSNHFLAYYKKINLGLLADQIIIALMSRHWGKKAMRSFGIYGIMALPL